MSTPYTDFDVLGMTHLVIPSRRKLGQDLNLIPQGSLAVSVILMPLIRLEEPIATNK